MPNHKSLAASTLATILTPSTAFVTAVALALLHFAPSPASAQVVEMDEFRVAASTTYTITADQKSMRVQRWIMEPGSTVELAADVDQWRIEALEAIFGENTTIVGRGLPGGSGTTPGERVGVPTMRHGHPGYSGTAGGSGSPGKRVIVHMGLVNAHGLTFDVRGGAGGPGGHGGKGGKGGRGRCAEDPDGRKGGPGGTGGSGGNGGAGGKVQVKWWPISDDGAEVVINALVNGGASGTPGHAGPGGDGGDGRRCTPFYTGDNGPRGNWGRAGSKGGDGKAGDRSIQVVAPLLFSREQ